MIKPWPNHFVKRSIFTIDFCRRLYFISRLIKNGKLYKKKIRSLKPSATLVINEKSKKLLEDGKKVFSFGFGQSPFPVPKGVISALKKNADKKNYLSTQGLAELRKAISKYLNGRTNKLFDHKNNFCDQKVYLFFR